MKSTWQTAFVTGGGSGIGRRMTEMLLARGTSVVIFDLKVPESVRDDLQNRATATNTTVDFYQADLRDAAGLLETVSAAVTKHGRPDLAFNSAGVQLAKPFDELSTEEFAFVVSVNLFGSRNFAAAVLPHMESGAQLVLVASLAGIVSNYAYAAYNASKFGVVGLAGALRLECKPRGIDICVVCPPEVDTPMVDAERASAHPATLKLKDLAGTLSVDKASAGIMRGMEARKYMIIPGVRARLTRRLAHWLPTLMNRASDMLVLGVLRKQA